MVLWFNSSQTLNRILCVCVCVRACVCARVRVHARVCVTGGREGGSCERCLAIYLQKMSLDIALHHKKCLELKECQESAVRKRGDYKVGSREGGVGQVVRGTYTGRTREGGRGQSKA
jgi:hypothetical protein